MTKQPTFGDHHPCPECGEPGRRRTSVRQIHTTHYMECAACGNSYKVRTGTRRSNLPPTLQMRRLMAQWVDDAVAQGLGE